MKKRSLQAVALLLGASLLMTACGGGAATTAAPGKSEAGKSEAAASGGQGGKISILTAQGSYHADEFTAMSAKMKELYGYEIDWQVLPDDQYYVLAKSKVATGEVPDIIEYNSPSNNIELSATTKCVPLNDQPWFSRLANPDLLKDPEDGKVYAMPRDVGTFYGGLYYNEKVLTDLGISLEQPKTMAELFDRLKEIKTKSNGAITPIYMSNADTWTTQIWMTLGFSVQNYPKDQDIYKELLANKLTFPDAPGFVKVMEEFKQLYKDGLVNENHLSATYDSAKEVIGTGKAAMVLNGEWFVPEVKAKYPDIKFGSWVVPYNDQLVIGTGAYVRAWFVMKDGKQVDKTLDFLNKWSSPEIMGIYFDKLPGFPAFKDVKSGDVDASVQHLVDTYIETGKYTYQINDPMGVISAIWPELWKLYVDMIASDRDPKEVLTEWQKQYADYMKQQQQPGF